MNEVGARGRIRTSIPSIASSFDSVRESNPRSPGQGSVYHSATRAISGGPRENRTLLTTRLQGAPATPLLKPVYATGTMLRDESQSTVRCAFRWNFHQLVSTVSPDFTSLLRPRSQQSPGRKIIASCMVRLTGLEPARLAAADSHSAGSTNSPTGA